MGDDATIDLRFAQLERRVDRIEDAKMQTELAVLKNEMQNLRNDIAGVRRWLVITATSVIGGSISFAFVALGVFG